MLSYTTLNLLRISGKPVGIFLDVETCAASKLQQLGGPRTKLPVPRSVRSCCNFDRAVSKCLEKMPAGLPTDSTS